MTESHTQLTPDLNNLNFDPFLGELLDDSYYDECCRLLRSDVLQDGNTIQPTRSRMQPARRKPTINLMKRSINTINRASRKRDAVKSLLSYKGFIEHLISLLPAKKRRALEEQFKRLQNGQGESIFNLYF